MGWLDDLRKWLDTAEGPAPDAAAPPPPTFTAGPRPFGVARDVAGVEWQTDKRTSALVRYRAAGTEAWSEVVDESRQQNHQRTLEGLTPDTEYQVEVTATVPRRGGGMVTRTITLRTLPAALAPPDQPPPVPPPPDQPPPVGEEPIPHASMTRERPGGPGGLAAGHPDPGRPGVRVVAAADLSGGPTKLVLADLVKVPGRMRQAGFRGRDNALWYTLSRSYAEWNWHTKAGDPDNHLSNQRRELHDIWANYINVVVSAMQAAPQTTAVILENDGHDRCGKTLGEYTQRQMNAVRGRVELGHFFQD